MFFFAFGAYMGGAEFQHPALIWKAKWQKVGGGVGEGGGMAPWKGKSIFGAIVALGAWDGTPWKGKSIFGAKIEN